MAERATIAALIAGIAVACGRSDNVVVAPPIPDSIGRIAYLVRLPGGGLIESTGLLGRDDAGRFPNPLSDFDDGQVVSIAGFTGEALDCAGFPPEAAADREAVAVAGPGDPVLPPPAFFVSGIASGGVARLAEERAPDLVAPWVKRRDPCNGFAFEATRVELGDGVIVRFLLPLDFDRVLLFGSEERYFVLFTDGRLEPLPLPADPAFLAGHPAGDDELWLFSRSGETYLGSVDAMFDPVAAGPVGGGRLFVDGVRGSDATEIYAVSQEDLLERFDGDAWTVLAGPGADAMLDEHGGVAYVGPGEALALLPRSRRLLRVRSGTVASVPLGEEIGASVTHHPILGSVAGGEAGGIYLETSDGWVLAGREPSEMPVRAMLPVASGLLFGTPLGLGWLWPGRGVCPAQPAIDTGLEALVSLGEDALALGGVRPAGTSGLWRIRVTVGSCEP